MKCKCEKMDFAHRLTLDFSTFLEMSVFVFSCRFMSFLLVFLSNSFPMIHVFSHCSMSKPAKIMAVLSCRLAHKGSK